MPKAVEITTADLEKIARAMVVECGLDPDMQVVVGEPARVSIPNWARGGYVVPHPDHALAMWQHYTALAYAALSEFGRLTGTEVILLAKKAA